VPTDKPGGEGEGLTRQRQRGAVEKHGKPLVSDEEIVVIASSTYGFLLPGGDMPTHHQTMTNLLQPG